MTLDKSEIIVHQAHMVSPCARKGARAFAMLTPKGIDKAKAKPIRRTACNVIPVGSVALEAPPCISDRGGVFVLRACLPYAGGRNDDGAQV